MSTYAFILAGSSNGSLLLIHSFYFLFDTISDFRRLPVVQRIPMYRLLDSPNVNILLHLLFHDFFS